MKEFFEDKKFRQDTLKLIRLANDVIKEYAQQGFILSLRQLYYQLVRRGYIENSDKMYKKLGTHVGNGRLAGLIDWNAIEDRGRETKFLSHWDSPGQIVSAAARGFQIDKWEDQPNHVEIMVEKDALSNILEPVCRRMDIRFTANKGYSSLSHLYRIGKRISRMDGAGKTTFILYFGDHDPSGMDMDRDILRRLSMFSDSEIEVERLALLMDQIEESDWPPNPAKVKDSRYKDYMLVYGEESWELDAVEPADLVTMVEDAVINLRDDELWDEAVERENEMILRLKAFAAEFDD